MSEFNEGDLIEAVKGDSKYRGRVTESSNQMDLARPLLQIDRLFSTDFLEHDGYAITVIEKAKPKVELPTEAGYYRTSDAYNSAATLQLTREGVWWWVGNEYQPNPERYETDEQVEAHGALTRLEPRAVTAKAVLDRLSEEYGPINSGSRLAEIAAEFGVTS